MIQSNAVSVFEWAVQHLPAIGWPTLIVASWKISAYFSKAASQITKTVDQIDSLATNHFPHMQASLQNQDQILKSVDESLKTLVERTPNI
jgi:hypothetical protein